MSAAARTIGQGTKTSSRGLGRYEVAAEITCFAQSIVNLYFVRARQRSGWLLVDAGLPLSAGQILRAAREQFGARAPEAIVLTHGHFDHVGGLPQLADLWDVPVYVHELEMPYVTGRSSYPPPDPTVGGGGMSWLSPLYPRGPIDLGPRAHTLPADGRIPDLPEWRWIATPGHSPGHVAFYREADGVLLAGDAFVTTRQESALGAVVKWPLVWRPPAYYTCDWQSARQSVERLMALAPRIAATGHGLPIEGDALHRGLERLVAHWEEWIPAHGRYVKEPAVTDRSGVVALPPAVDQGSFAASVLAAGVGLGFALGCGMIRPSNR